MTQVVKDGYTRTVYCDSVLWHLDTDKPNAAFVVARFPFVPHYHLCDFVHSDYFAMEFNTLCERPLQTFKTLAQALAVLRVIEGARP